MTDHRDPTAKVWRPSRRRLAERARAVTQARWFALAVFSLILANAALLGVETYSGVIEDWHQWEVCKLKLLVTGLVCVGIGMLVLVAGR
jgi:voltage-gated sodium channel